MLENQQKYVNIDFLTLFEKIDKNTPILNDDYTIAMYENKIENKNKKYIKVLKPSEEYVSEIISLDENCNEPFIYKVHLPNASLFVVKRQLKYLFKTSNQFELFINFIEPQFRYQGKNSLDDEYKLYDIDWNTRYKLYSIPIVQTSEGLKIDFDHFNISTRPFLTEIMVK